MLRAGDEAAALVMGAFAYGGPSRFSNGKFGCYYAAAELETAIAETAHHQGNAFRDRRADRGDFVELVDIEASMEGTLADLRPLRKSHQALYDPDDYTVSQLAGTTVFAAGHAGVLYSSVRDRRKRDCFAAFTPEIILGAWRAARVRYSWSGTDVEVERLHAGRPPG